MESIKSNLQKQFDNKLILEGKSEYELKSLLFEVFLDTMKKNQTFKDNVQAYHSEEEKVFHEINLFLTGEFRNNDVYLMNKLIASDLYENIYFNLKLIKTLKDSMNESTIKKEEILDSIQSIDKIESFLNDGLICFKTKNILSKYLNEYIYLFDKKDQKSQHELIFNIITCGII